MIALIASVLSEVTNKVFPLIVLHFAQAKLGIEQFGFAQFGIYLTDIFIPFVVWGYKQKGAIDLGRASSDEVKREIIGSIFSVRLVHFASVSLLLSGLVFLYEPYHQYRELCFWLGFVLLSTVFDMGHVILAEQKIHVLSGISIICKTLSLVLILLLVSEPEDAILYASLSFGANGLINFFGFFYVLKKWQFRVNWDVKNWVHQFKWAMPIGIGFFLIYLTDKLEMVWVEYYLSARDVGLYTGPWRLLQSVLPVLFKFGVVFFSEIVVLKENDKYQQMISNSISLLFMLTIPLAVGGFFMSSDVLRFVFGDVFVEVSQVLSILLIGAVPFSLTVVYGQQVLLVNDQTKNYNRALTFGIVLIALFAHLLIPSHGLMGIALTSVIARFVVAGLIVFFSLKYISQFPYRFVAKICLSAGVMALVLYISKDTNWVVRFLVAGGSYFSILMILAREKVLYFYRSIRKKEIVDG